MMKRKFILFTIALCLMLDGNVIASATEDSEEKKVQEIISDNLKIIEKEGYEEEDLNVLSADTVEDVVEAIEDGENPQIETTNVTFDELKNAELLINQSVDELSEKMDVSKERIIEAKNELYTIFSLEDDELKKRYNFTESQIKAYRSILRNKIGDEKYIDIKDEEKVTLSSGISTAKLSFSQVVNREKTKKVKYHITNEFNWKKAYHPWSFGFEDVVASAWSGGFTSKTVSKDVKYYTMYGIMPWYTWGKKKINTKKAKADKTASKGIKYSFSQENMKFAGCVYAKSGKFEFDLTSKYDKAKGRNAEIISRYGHKGIGFSGVSISASPSISFKSAYSTTDDDKTSCILNY